MKRTFHIRCVLAMITGLWDPRGDFSELQSIFDFLPPDPESTGLSSQVKRDHLLAQFPQLKECEQRLSNGEIITIKAGIDQNAIDGILYGWVDRLAAEHGEYLEVQA